MKKIFEIIKSILLVLALPIMWMYVILVVVVVLPWALWEVMKEDNKNLYKNNLGGGDRCIL